MRLTCVLALVLTGCGPAPTTEEGCPIEVGTFGRARMEACIAAYHEEKARQQGGVVTRCQQVGGSVSCSTY